MDQELADTGSSVNNEPKILSDDRPSTTNGMISTNDILNHDYNQLRIEEGRLHRLLLKKELNEVSESDLFITHVTLNLDIVENRPHSGASWKYNAIKKNNSFAKAAKVQQNINGVSVQTRPRYIFFVHLITLSFSIRYSVLL